MGPHFVFHTGCVTFHSFALSAFAAASASALAIAFASSSAFSRSSALGSLGAFANSTPYVLAHVFFSYFSFLICSSQNDVPPALP